MSIVLLVVLSVCLSACVCLFVSMSLCMSVSIEYCEVFHMYNTRYNTCSSMYTKLKKVITHSCVSRLVQPWIMIHCSASVVGYRGWHLCYHSNNSSMSHYYSDKKTATCKYHIHWITISIFINSMIKLKFSTIVIQSIYNYCSVIRRPLILPSY